MFLGGDIMIDRIELGGIDLLILVRFIFYTLYIELDPNIYKGKILYYI